MNVVEEKKKSTSSFSSEESSTPSDSSSEELSKLSAINYFISLSFFCVDVLLEVSTDNKVYLIGNKTNYYYRQTNTLKFFFGYLIVIIINIFRNRGDFVNDNVCCLCGMPLDRPVIFS